MCVKEKKTTTKDTFDTLAFLPGDRTGVRMTLKYGACTEFSVGMGRSRGYIRVGSTRVVLGAQDFTISS